MENLSNVVLQDLMIDGRTQEGKWTLLCSMALLTDPLGNETKHFGEEQILINIL